MIKPSLQLSLASIAAFAITATAQIPAFPGAEGYGAYATGGRGGDVYHVTTLAASGAGSFADAIATVPVAGRTIVFDVSGYIRLPSGSSGTRLTSSKVTIAGQTAPGDGIGFYNNFFRISGDDVVIRHVRFRMGYYGSGGDCVDLDSGCNKAILDHVSMEFSTDENMSSFGSPPENLTLQYSINSWGLETHSCGGLWDQNHATSSHNLWAYNHTRNPKSRPSGLLEWINNVTYDWDIGFIMGDSQSVQNWKANVISNYFIGPPGNTHSKALVKGTVADNGQPNFTVFLAGNLIDVNGDGILNGVDNGYGIVEGTAYAPGTSGLTPGNLGYYQSPGAIAGSSAGVATDTPLLAYKKVVSSAGALRLDSSYAGTIRDEVDTILLNRVVTQTHTSYSGETGIHKESDTGASNSGFGYLNSTLPFADTDRDGTPDLYENAAGMNAGVDDHNTAFSAGAISGGSTFFPTNSPTGYTYLEEYLFFMASPHTFVAKNTAGAPTYVDIDLARYTSGFTNLPVAFAPGNVTNGSAVLQGDGHTVRFTPTLNYSGRAWFDFTVTDGDGSSWKQRFMLIVTTAGIPKNLLWKGDGTANVWNASTANWLKDGTPAVFDTGDSVTFDDSGFNSPSISITNTVTPGAITVNADNNYTLTGTGSISGTAALLKSGSGTLTLNTGNAFSGGTTVNGGAVIMGSQSALGTGGVTLNNASLTFPGSGGTFSNPLNLSGTCSWTGSSSANIYWTGNVTGSGDLTLNFGNHLLTLQQSFAGFSGSINTGTSTGNLRTYDSDAYAFSTVDLDLGNAGLYHHLTYGVACSIGALRGNSGARLAGGDAGSTVVTDTFTIGSLGLDTTFAGTIANGANANHSTAVIKIGGGTLTLTGASTYTGATTVSNGTLQVDGSLGNTAVEIWNAGTTLAGSGTIGTSSGGAVLIHSTTMVSPGSATGAPGTLTVGNGLNMLGTTLLFDLSSNPAAGNDKIVMQGGPLTIGSPIPAFKFNLFDGVLGSGTYTLVTGASSSSGNQPTSNLPTDARQTFTLSRTGTGIQLVVGGNAASLVWKGTNAAGAIWDNSVTNWINGTAPDKFYNFDAVTFNDASANGNLAINGAVAPRAMTVNNGTTGYTFGGTGTITGDTSLIKQGAGTLTINNSNNFTGGALLAGGTVALGNDAANAYGLGTGVITFNGGTLTMHDDAASYNGATYYLSVPAGQTGTLNADSRSDIYGTLTGSGTFNLRVPWIRTALFGDWSAFTGHINLTTDSDGGDLRMAPNYSYPGFPNADVNLADKASLYYIGILAQGAGTTIPIGSLSGGSLSTLMGGPTSGRNLTYRIGGKGMDATFAGTIREQDAAVDTTSIIKAGAGVWTLGGTNNAWNGGTTVEAGTLRISGSTTCGNAVDVQDGAQLSLLNGSLAADAVNIASGATFSGSGNITGDLNNDGTFICTNGPLNLTGNLTFGDSALVKFALGSNSNSVTVSGELNLTGQLTVTNAAGFGPGSYVLFTHTGTLGFGNFVLASAPAGYNYNFDTNTVGVVKLIVSLPPSPVIGNTGVSGGKLVFSGSGGTPGEDYYVLTATNLATPAANWLPVLTNQFDSNGNFAVTNTPATNAQTFYHLKVP